MRETFEPHRAAWHFLAVLIGFSAIVTPPRGLGALVPHWELSLWAALLMLSGIAGALAPLRQSADLPDALAIERAALWVQMGTLAWIITASMWLRGTADGLGVIAYLVWIIANAWRDRRIASAITKSRRPPGE